MRMKRTASASTWLVCLSLGAPSGSAEAPPGLTAARGITTFDVPGAMHTDALSINGPGQIAGDFLDAGIVIRLSAGARWHDHDIRRTGSWHALESGHASSEHQLRRPDRGLLSGYPRQRSRFRQSGERAASAPSMRLAPVGVGVRGRISEHQ